MIVGYAFKQSSALKGRHIRDAIILIATPRSDRSASGLHKTC